MQSKINIQRNPKVSLLHTSPERSFPHEASLAASCAEHAPWLSSDALQQLLVPSNDVLLPSCDALLLQPQSLGSLQRSCHPK